MIHIRRYGIEIYGSQEFVDSSDTTLYHIHLAHAFFRRPLFQKLASVYGSRNPDLEGYVILHAHSTGPRHTWRFRDGSHTKSIQSFVDRHDKKSLAILLMVCNPHKHTITSASSLVAHPTANVNFLKVSRGLSPIELYVPWYGYVGRSYSHLNRVIRDLS